MASLLVIDDDPDLRDLVAAIGLSAGWAVTTAGTVPEALAAFDAADPDVVLLDLGLAGQDGRSVLERLKAAPATEWVPVVVLSGASDRATELEVLRAGAQDMVTKPFDIDRLLARLDAARRVAVANRAARAALAELAGSEARFRRVIAEAPVGVAELDVDGRCLDANASLGDIFALPPGQLIGTHLLDEAHCEQRATNARVLAELRSGQIETWTGQGRHVRADGAQVWIRIHATVLHDEGIPERILCFLTDITEDVIRAESLEEQATVDHLTGLANRAELYRQLEYHVMSQTPDLAVLFVDLDGFKQVNDTVGHDGGDALLTAVGARLRAAVRPNDTVGRVGGDEMVVVCINAPLPVAETVAARLRASIAAPYRFADQQIRIDASVGIAHLRAHDTVATLLGRADQAMYEVKRTRHAGERP